MGNVLVSVIIPIYNKAEFVESAIGYVLKQSFKDYEIILVDDGSTDLTSKICRKYQNNDRIRYVCQNNQGVSAARNYGIKIAKGKLITFLDVDDEWKPDHLETLINVYKREGELEAIYFTAYKIYLLDGTTIDMGEKCLKQITMNKEYAIVHNMFQFMTRYTNPPLHTNSVMVPKTIFNQLGGFVVGLKRDEDIDMWCRIFLYYPAVAINYTTTAYHRENSDTRAMYQNEINWPFIKVAENYMEKHPEDSRKENIMHYVDMAKLNRVKFLLMSGKRKKAIKNMRDIKTKELCKKKYFMNLLMFFIPPALLKKMYVLKKKNYLSE